eukprot:6227248-Amphidinium_carterae.1
MIGDPVLAAWMFPDAWSHHFSLTRLPDPKYRRLARHAMLLDKYTMLWKVPLPGPMAVMHAQWGTITSKNVDEALEGLRQPDRSGMARRFDDIGAEFGFKEGLPPTEVDIWSTVPFFWNLM